MAYKEKENGRAVATAANVSGATWETSVYPLPYNIPVEIAIQIVCELTDAAEDNNDGELTLHLPLTFAQPVSSIAVRMTAEDGTVCGCSNLQGGATLSTMPDGLTFSFDILSPVEAPPISSALHDGSFYWAGCVPKAALDVAFGAQPSLNSATDNVAMVDLMDAGVAAHVALLVDVSRSTAPMAEAHLSVIDALQASYASTGRSLVLTLWSVSRRSNCLGERLSAAEAKTALQSTRYDGGTDLSLLTALLQAAGPAGARCEAAVLLSDGVNNLLAKELPDLAQVAQDSGGALLPVHVPLPPQSTNANLGLLRWLAYQSGGSASGTLSAARSFADLVSGASAQTKLAKMVLADLADNVAAWTDDELSTTPDFRLSKLNIPAKPDGSLRLSGVCNPNSRPPPTSLTLHVSRGAKQAVITLSIAPPQAEAVTGDNLSRSLGRLLKVQHTLLSLAQLQVEQHDPVVAATLACEMACACGLASEHSSLIKLSLPEQFAEHDLTCPPDHAAHEQWKLLAAQREKDATARKEAEATKVRNKLTSVLTPMADRYNQMVSEKPPEWGKTYQVRHTTRSGGKGGGMARCAGGRARCARSCANNMSASSAPLGGAMMLGGGGGRGGGGRGRNCAMRAYSIEPEMDEGDADADGDDSDDSDADGDDMMGGWGDAEPQMMACAMMSEASPPPPCAPMCADAPPPPRPAAAPAMGAAPTCAKTTAVQHCAAGPVDTDENTMDSDDVYRGINPSPALAAPAAPPAPSGPPASLSPPHGSAELREHQPAVEAIGEAWLLPVVVAYDESGVDHALGAFDAQLIANPSLAGLPSTFILASEVLHARGVNGSVCADLLFNVLEAKLPDTQTCRVVAYHLLSYGCYAEAVRLLELVRETLAPAEPHSFTDLAFARFHKLRHSTKDEEGASAVRTEMARVVSDLTTVLVGTEWANRFREIEWPVLILLSWAVAWVEHRLAASSAVAGAMEIDGEGISVWPENQLPAAIYRLGGNAGPQLDVFVWLGWDTDHTDVDLHVLEPTGEEVYYSHNRSGTTGARVSRDFTDGYGPEVYTLPSAPKGSYKVQTNYYASHQDSAKTGSTSAVMWSIKGMGRFESEEVHFASVRLTKHKQRQQVFAIECDGTEIVVC